MKIIPTLILILAISPAYAEIFKCEVNGSTTYQQFPCKQSGEEFIPAKDISKQEQKAAVEKLDKDLAIQAEKELLKKEEKDKERLIRAQEEQADAAYRNANANRAKVIQDADLINRDRRRVRPYYYPETPIQPIEKPLLDNRPVTE